MKEEQVKQQFVVCLNDEGYEASLELGKLYRVIPDEQAAAHGYIRVVDESGEDYAYDTNRFFSVELPEQVEETTYLLSSDKMKERLLAARESDEGIPYEVVRENLGI